VSLLPQSGRPQEDPSKGSENNTIIKITRSYLKNIKMARGQGWRRIVTGGIYVNILRITIQAGR
jgi:hypothetical protein